VDPQFKLYFYIHPGLWPQGEIPDTADVPWAGFAFGIYAWTIQTFLRLRQAGVDCELVSTLPQRGIVFAHRDCLSSEDGLYDDNVMPARELFIVDMCADLPLYPYANLHISQNPFQAKTTSRCFAVPHWPQPGLIPRDPQRGDKFENVYFFGNEKYLPPELRSPMWITELEQRGLRWKGKLQEFFFDKPESYLKINNWCDYSEVDAVVAVRRFQSGKTAKHHHKPATKLFNCWIAGVPAILGAESAYREIRNSELDYIEVNNIQETLQALERLKNDSGLRAAMTKNGFERSVEILPAATVEAWKALIATQIIPAYQRWLALPAWRQKLDTALNRVFLFIGHVKRRVLENFQ